MSPLLAILMSLAPPAAAAPVPGPGCTIAATKPAPLFVGVTSQSVTVTCPSTGGSSKTAAYVVRVDLAAPGLSFETSGGAKDGLEPELPTAFLLRTGSQVAFNANLFTLCCSYAPPVPAETDLCGLEISGGAILSAWNNAPPPCHGYPFPSSLAVIKGKPAIVAAKAVPAGASVAVTGSHDLVVAGVNVAPPAKKGDEFFGPNARTVVGLSSGNGTLWVAAVSRETSSGLTLPQAAQMLMLLGAANAINLDGGGSTSLAVDAGGGKARLLNVPSHSVTPCSFSSGGGCERYVGASFGIHAQPLSRVRR
ncbi:MAG TPA: phosphodiester glycosidase family protein [Allosphingosinicella sp.]